MRIGQIVRAHGVHGDVKLQPLTDDLGRFHSLTEAFLEERGNYRPIQTGNVRLLKDACVLHLEGFDTVEAAEKLRGSFLCVDRAHAVRLPKDTFFVADLIGCETCDTNGNTFGKITDVYQTGANDVYEIANGKLLVPALKRVLHEVDIAGGRIVFDADVLAEVGLTDAD